MYQVSNDYRNKILSAGVRGRRITGRLDSISFTSADILADSLKYTNQMAKGADISLGGVFTGTLNLSFMRSFSDNIQRGSWRGRKISLSVGLKIDENTWEDIPLGVFVIDNAEHSTTGVDITAYDYMPRFDKTLSISQTAGYPYDYLNYCCTRCNVLLGMSRAEVEALPNGTEYLGMYPESDMTTYRDLVSWIACTLGGYATINREGKLEIRTFASGTDIALNKNQRAAGGKWCDFETTYTGVSIVNMEDDTVRYYGATIDDGLTMKIGSNPFMQYGTDETKERMANAIIEALSRFIYTPFVCSSFVDPAIDLGDIIDYTQGLAGTLSKGMVMKITYTFNKGVKLEGFGRNPALFGAQSKTDKNIAGLISKEDSGKDRVTIVDFENVSEIDIDSSWEQVAKLRIGVMESQNILLHGVIKTELEEAGTVYVRYKLNGEVLPFIHACQFPIGEDTITLFLAIHISNEFVNDIIVEIMGDEAIGFVDVGNAKIALQGVGVTTGNWDGVIQIPEEGGEPEYYSFPFNMGLGFGYSDGEPQFIENDDSRTINSGDSYSFPFHAGLGFAYSETQNTRITIETPSYRLTTEDGTYNLTTEDGSGNIVTEE